MKRLNDYRFFAIAVLAAVLMLAGYACTRAPEDDGSGETVIRVGTKAITVGEYQLALKRLLPKEMEEVSAEEEASLKKDLVNQLIEEELLVQEADRAGITVTDDELAAEVEEIESGYGDDTFKQELLERYGGVEQWKEDLRKKLLITKVIETVISSRVTVTDDEMKKYYKENPEEFVQSERVHARMIVVGSEEQARSVKARLTPDNFGTVASEVSLSPEAEDGGDLGFFSRGEMPREFEEAVFKLKPGEISPVVKTAYGYHIFYVEEKKAKGSLKFGDVKEEIREKLYQQRAESEFDEWISSMKINTRIVVREELL